jgi:hypothetical protein
MTPEQAAEAPAWRACSLPHTVTSAEQYERLFVEKRYVEKHEQIAADIRTRMERRANGTQFLGSDARPEQRACLGVR